MRGKAVTGKVIIFMVLCLASFLAGSLITSRTWSTSHNKLGELAPDYDHKRRFVEGKAEHIMGEVSKTHKAIQSLEKTISILEMELTASRMSKSGVGGVYLQKPQSSNHTLQKVFAVIGINTAFSSRKRRDSVKATWMPTGLLLRKLEREKGIVMRFVIGHSATAGGVLDKALDKEEAEYNDFLRLNHVEGYHQLSTKTRLYFSTAVSIWDADFYVKVDDDVHVNLGMLATTVAQYRAKPRVYIGCMKFGPVRMLKGEKYHEPEYWKFGEDGNKYFRHVTGQIYGISKNLAAYISINSSILHRFANEELSLGSWMIGLEVEHVDDLSRCCGTPPALKELGIWQTKNEMLRTVLTDTEASFQNYNRKKNTEQETSRANNKTMTELVHDYRNLAQELHDRIESLTRENGQYCLQLQRLKLKMEKKDNVMNETVTQASNVAHKLVELAVFVRDLKQIDGLSPDHAWKITWLMIEIKS
ncbi:probable beta-1,3-galactosyltransferase 8 [Hibiscus syriacus]|uniref:probable beta-1,3-galactosyltransferase 8 n=1 Tax=Hibiscus syriacus TaxID=106335 RepID=UPI001922F3F3|nr:probable beta-1,3-galactosyltransferase 8 [Hibiscus syriacus]